MTLVLVCTSCCSNRQRNSPYSALPCVAGSYLSTVAASPYAVQNPSMPFAAFHNAAQGVQVLMACAKVKQWIVVMRSLPSFPPGTLVHSFPTGKVSGEERLVGFLLAGLATIQTQASVRTLTIALFITDLAGKPGNSCTSYACDPYN